MYTAFVTGGIGSGKTIFTSRLAQHGAVLIDLDKVGRDVLEDADVQSELVAEYGSGVVVAGSVNRSELARRAFQSEESTKALNAITHPRILDRLTRVVNGGCRCSCTGPTVTVVEVQLIDQAGDVLGLADEIICISTPREKRLRNAMGRGMSQDDFCVRDARQLDDAARRAWCTTVVENDGTLEEFLGKADAWWRAREVAGWRNIQTESGNRL